MKHVEGAAAANGFALYGFPRAWRAACGRIRGIADG